MAEIPILQVTVTPTGDTKKRGTLAFLFHYIPNSRVCSQLDEHRDVLLNWAYDYTRRYNALKPDCTLPGLIVPLFDLNEETDAVAIGCRALYSKFYEGLRTKE